MSRIRIGKRWIGDGEKTYFIADISANHDGQLARAKELIWLAAESGADAAKFQNFKAAQIVSDPGFRKLGSQQSHQAKWKKSVYEVYQAASLPWEWTETLKKECDKAKIDYFSAPYDIGAVDMLDPYVDMFKIGSGDITWLEILQYIARKGKPIFLATGASSEADVRRAIRAIRPINRDIVLMQCNTNYTGSLENFRHIHLNVLKNFHEKYPDLILGLSDHTPGHATTLGAVALGARAIEKHFTDRIDREGPDHPFSMTPKTWSEMVERTRELELALGETEKRIADNEGATVVIQRRCLRASRNLKAGTILTRRDIDVLRPAPIDAMFPYELPKVIGARLKAKLSKGQEITSATLKMATRKK